MRNGRDMLTNVVAPEHLCDHLQKQHDMYIYMYILSNLSKYVHVIHIITYTI